MELVNQKLSSADWTAIMDELNTSGYAIIRSLMPGDKCTELIENYNKSELYRKTVVMERHQFGRGEYKYFNYPLPPLIQEIREKVYSKLAPIANHWMNVLNIDRKFPESLEELHKQCIALGQTKPTPLILKYESGGFNTMHQDLYGDLFFPFQSLLFLTEPGMDFTGGEFVLMQQIPRAQSRAIVLNPQRGDMLIFTTNFRPEKSSRGYYRVNMKHGVSEIHSGTRLTLGIIFHDALS